MKCPVCKTECGDAVACPECGFEDLNPTFLSKEEGEAWIENVVWPWRRKYWETLDWLEIKDKVLVKCHDPGDGVTATDIPYGIEIIGDNAFEDWTAVEYVKLPNTIKYIGRSAFEECELSEIHLPNSVISIGDNAFLACLLDELYLPASLKHIGSYITNLEVPIELDPQNKYYTVENDCLIENETGVMLRSCSKDVEKLCISPMATSFDKYAIDFHALKYIELAAESKYFSIVNSCLIQKSGCVLFSVCNKDVERVEVPSIIREIGQQAFYCCQKLKEIIFPDNLKQISKDAFCGCKMLEKVVLPDNLEAIGQNAFFATAFTQVCIPKSVAHIGCHALPISCKTVFCEAESKPEGWHPTWHILIANPYYSAPNVYWGGTWHYNKRGEPVPND